MAPLIRIEMSDDAAEIIKESGRPHILEIKDGT